MADLSVSKMGFPLIKYNTPKKNAIGGTVTFTCKFGIPAVPKTATCGKDGQWSKMGSCDDFSIPGLVAQVAQVSRFANW